jgi:acyl carrier protein
MGTANDIRNQLMELIREKLQRIGIRENEPGEAFDLVKSGLLNSLEFVDLVASLENMNDREIDFEKAFATGVFTTIGGLTRAFENK